MIVADHEIEAVRRRLRALAEVVMRHTNVGRTVGDSRWDHSKHSAVMANRGCRAINLYLRQYPHFFLPAGFDQLVIEDMDTMLNNRLARDRSFQKIAIRMRVAATGVWLYYNGINIDARYTYPRPQVNVQLTTKHPDEPMTFDEDAYAPLLTPAEFATFETGTFDVSLDAILDRCDAMTHRVLQPATIEMARLWHTSEARARSQIIPSVRDLLLDLSNDRLGYSDLHWRELEEIVGELLRTKGMRVHMTSRSADGGRDIVATGPLMSGEPLTIAVEVKHKRKVLIDDVRSRLHANRHFPALLFVTSGTFSAAVIRQKNSDDTWYRLLLKNGGGLRQWIDEYARRTAPRHQD
jgi:hypothetical protein